MTYNKGDKIVVNFAGVERVVEFNGYHLGREGGEFSFRDYNRIGMIWLGRTKNIVGLYHPLSPLKSLKKVKL